MSDPDHPFNPADHLRELRGDQYLDVKWRLKWLRQEQPDAEIETVLVRLDSWENDKGRAVERALFKCVIRFPSGAVSTGYGSETTTDFPDFLEKAETKSIGRACAHIGYGTQFIDADRRIVDSPVGSRPTALPRPQRNEAPPAVSEDADEADLLATLRQTAWIKMAAKRVGIDTVGDLDERSIREYGNTHEQLSRARATQFILALEREYAGRNTVAVLS